MIGKRKFYRNTDIPKCSRSDRFDLRHKYLIMVK